MESLGTWEAILLGAIALLVIFWFRPGIKATLEKSRQAKEKDWKSVLIPLVLVVAFVVFLLAIT